MTTSDYAAGMSTNNGRREERNKARVREMEREVFYKHNFDYMDQIYVPDYIDYDIFPGQPPGLEGFKQAMRLYAQAYPDLRARSDLMIAEGDIVAMQGFFEGTNRGFFMGVPPSNIKVITRRCEVIRFNDEGRAAERWGVGAELKTLQTMGVIGKLVDVEDLQDSASVAQRFSREFFVFGNPAAIADLVDERGRVDSKGMLALFQFASAFSDVEAQVEESVSGVRRTATVQVGLRGNHTGSGLPVSAPTNRRVGASFELFCRVANDNRISQVWIDHEPANLLRQVAYAGSPT